MFDEYGLGNDGAGTSRSCQADKGDDQMKEKDDNIANSGMVSKPQERPDLGPI
jgi:hypothetical protein